MDRKHQVRPAVFIALLQNGGVLLSRRYGTGFNDGLYDLPAGHLERGETILGGAVREVKEETGIELNTTDLKLFHIGQSEFTLGIPYLYLMLKCDRWQGRPKIIERKKADDLRFFNLKNLPDNMTPYVREALRHIDEPTVSFSYFEPATTEA